jgi:hypothetical protein
MERTQARENVPGRSTPRLPDAAVYGPAAIMPPWRRRAAGALAARARLACYFRKRGLGDAYPRLSRRFTLWRQTLRRLPGGTIPGGFRRGR